HLAVDLLVLAFELRRREEHGRLRPPARRLHLPGILNTLCTQGMSPFRRRDYRWHFVGTRVNFCSQSAGYREQRLLSRGPPATRCSGRDGPSRAEFTSMREITPVQF